MRLFKEQTFQRWKDSTEKCRLVGQTGLPSVPVSAYGVWGPFSGAGFLSGVFRNNLAFKNVLMKKYLKKLEQMLTKQFKTSAFALSTVRPVKSLLH